MQIGLIGAGNMASAMARGWGRPVLASDGGSGRARELVEELGGEALTNAEVAERADVVVLAHKPKQLEAVAAEIAPRHVLSVLGGITLGQLRAAYPDARVTRVTPNTAVGVRKGVLVVPEECDALDELAELGTVVRVPEAQMSVAGAISGVGPAYVALVAEAWTDAAVRHGMSPEVATRLVAGTFAGTAALLEHDDTLGIRRAVTSPGGSTARGLAALEGAGVRHAFAAAMDEVLAA
jgi:pyrroline-5-carboxylate reductase